MRKTAIATLCICTALLLASCLGKEAEYKADIQQTATAINSALIEARAGLEQLSNEAVLLYARRQAFVPAPMAAHYKYYEGTVYYKDEDDGLCGMWASGFKPIGTKEQEEIQFLEKLQPAIKQYNQSHEIVALTHLLTTDHVGIFYPYFNGVSFFEPLVDFYEAFMPFYSVAPKHNPEKETRWIEPYIDAAGNGYVCTVTTPIYQGSTFKASIGADIPLLPIGKQFLANDRLQMMVTADSTVIYATPVLLEAIPIKALDELYYTKSVVIDEYASSEFSLMANPSSEIRQLAELIRKGETAQVTITGDQYSIFIGEIEETSWRVVELVKN